MAQLILIRHGESLWNKKGIFTGWIDIPLSRQGVDEALRAGEQLKTIRIDCIYTSDLIRSIMTALLIMTVHQSGKVPVVLHSKQAKFYDWRSPSGLAEGEFIPVCCAWELNERMYGTLQGQGKEKIRMEFGEAQIKAWRRDFTESPPGGESLKMTSERTIPYFTSNILPHLIDGETVLLAAHGNSLRSIIMHLEHLREKEVLSLEVPTGEPWIYTYQKGKFIRENDGT
ncbi:MAG: histidine phosphatase family protein [Chlamydiales bacterium]